MTTIFQNEFVQVSYSEKDKDISFRDLKDFYNGTSGYTTLKRNFKQAVAFIQHLSTVETLKDDLTFSDIRKVLDEKLGMRCHTYCSVD